MPPKRPPARASGADRVSAQPGQGDLGVRPELVGLYEVVQAPLGLLILGLLTRGLVRVIGHGAWQPYGVYS